MNSSQLAQACLFAIAATSMGCAVSAVDDADAHRSSAAVEGNVLRADDAVARVVGLGSVTSSHAEGPAASSVDASDPLATASSCPEEAITIVQDHVVTCLFMGIELPPSSRVEPYCDLVQFGYLGFTWPLEGQGADAYTCPAGSVRAVDAAEQAFCLFFVHPMPASPQALKANCDRLAQGEISYSFR